jgi:hypothetical protein
VVPLEIQFLIVALRLLLGWNEKRMAKGLEQRGIAKVSYRTVGRIFARYHLPTRTYHSLARCDGIPRKHTDATLYPIDVIEQTIVPLGTHTLFLRTNRHKESPFPILSGISHGMP